MGTSYNNMSQSERDAFDQNVRAAATGTDPATNITSASSTALTVAAAAGTNYGFQVDESTVSAVTGVKVKSAAAGSGLAISVIGGNSAENLTLDAKGTGTITVAGTSTGVLNVGSGAVLLSTVTIASATNIVAGGLNIAAGGASITGQTTIVSGGLNVSAGGATITGQTQIVSGGLVVSAGGATMTGQTQIVGPTTASGLIVTASANVGGATLAALNVVASTASQAVMSISGVFVSTASINLAANKTAFIIPVYHETQRVWGYIAASIGVS